MIEVLYAMIPAYVANMTPVLARGLPGKARLDFGFSLRGEPLLGANKTWKGFLIGTALGTFVGVVLSNLYWPFVFSAFWWSFLVSFGALTGDAVKSFFKRRMKVKSGRPWIPFDQLDFVVGAFAFGSIVYFPGWAAVLAVGLLSVLGHIAVNHAAFYLGIRKEKW
ncbi:CDP-archaeol synthase [Candidatus Woesearchaeota archaeon]|nr:MAG: CDP-archaeol synthase [Candidatus Woesearchaeota archaeon]